MRRIKNKTIEVNGFLADQDMRIYSMPFRVIINNDDYGCSLSIDSEHVNLQYTIPMEQVFEVLEVER